MKYRPAAYRGSDRLHRCNRPRGPGSLDRLGRSFRASAALYELPEVIRRGCTCYTFHVRRIVALLLLLLLASGLASCAPRFQDDSGHPGDAAIMDLAPGDGGSSACLGTGTGQVRVMLQLAPGLSVAHSEVWVVAMCLVGLEEHAVRVVRADSSGAPTLLAGLAAGSYVVRASAGIVPSVASTRLDLTAGATAVTSLVLVPSDPPLAQLRAAPVVADGGLDASVIDASVRDAAFDAAQPASDAALVPTGVTVEARIVRPGGTDVIGSALAVLQPRDGTTFDVTVRVTAGVCASCVRIGLVGAEIRTMQRGDPLGFAVTRFDYDAISPGFTATTERRTVMGSFTSADLGLSVTVFGGIADPDGGMGVPDR